MIQCIIIHYDDGVRFTTREHQKLTTQKHQNSVCEAEIRLVPIGQRRTEIIIRPLITYIEIVRTENKI